MQIPFGPFTTGAWLTWLLYWVWSARGVKQATRVESSLSRMGKYWLPIILAVALLQPLKMFSGTVLDANFVPPALWLVWLGLLMTYAGLLFACWARVILGRNWSGVVQLKQDHELIEAGPYRYVRHPIYSGLLLAFLGTAVMIGEWRALLAVAIVAVSFWRKLRLEERWLGEYFGDAYADYMRRVKALVPGVL
ncbi:isoprenylcysteine carboxylmethyltransferase family protein [Rhodanobacter sp. C03]|uniref:methyltransferase family protein n=1 Tax=Rhodanobacter sp. C03 TaxID=1945858 RepID=UPI000984C379|nr:isoprenylcysteine carboxylmethyltransferase family protein [Rhodanobacter sp. C03]OOG59432.1 isoprenylcysteine carboxyl methyltransferase [Rhodanobacter sp. C03]